MLKKREFEREWGGARGWQLNPFRILRQRYWFAVALNVQPFSFFFNMIV